MKFVIKKSTSTTQPYYWIIKSGSNTLATSETYVSKESVKVAIASVQTNAADATVEDET